MTRILFFLSVIFILASCQNPSTDSSSSSTTSTTVEKNDQNMSVDSRNMASDSSFVANMVAGNIAELKLASLAQSKAQTTDVKDLAKMLEQDHTQVLVQLKDYASKKGITVPSEEKPEAKEKYNELNAKSGKEFDKDWCDLMEKKHKEGIEKFGDMANSSSADPDLKALAADVLPKLRTHLEHVMKCQNILK